MREFTDYKPLTDDEQTRLFGQCTPQGLAWNAKGDPDSNLYKLMKSLSTSINVFEAKIYEMVTQWDVRVTTDLITEWEAAVGIPDECRGLAEDIETRRIDVLTKLRKVPIITVEDYQDLAEVVTGEPAAQWNIRPGSDDFPADPLYRFVLLVSPPSVTSGAFDYPIGTVTGNTQAELDAMAAETPDGRYLFKPDTIFPGYPLAGYFRTDILKCVFRKVTPAEVAIVFD